MNGRPREELADAPAEMRGKEMQRRRQTVRTTEELADAPSEMRGADAQPEAPERERQHQTKDAEYIMNEHFYKTIAEALGASPLDKDESDEQPADISDARREAMIRDLIAVQERYGSGCPFKPGDLVTPRRGVNYTNAGVPHIVLEIDPDPAPFRPQTDARDVGCTTWGSRPDMRVAHRGAGDEDHLIMHWVESWAFRPLEPDEIPEPLRSEIDGRPA